VKKYVVWNVREGMTQPGQWYLDRTAGQVVYWPLPGEDMAKADVLAPTMESVIRLAGTKEAPVKDVTVRGLALSLTNTPLVAGGFGAIRFEGALAADFAENCHLLDLTVVNVNGQGLKARNCTGLRVSNCQVHDTGACGVYADGGDNEISDSDVHDIGLTYPSAIGLWIQGKRAKVSHNEIHETPYTAVAGGGEDHVIEGNLIYHAMKQLHDGAGIYITFCKRITVRGNFIRDIVETGGYGASAYYLDEQAEDCLVEDNLSLRVARPSHNHMAKNDTIRHNVFVMDGEATLSFPKSTGYRFEQNIVCAKGKITFTNPPAIAQSAANVVYSATGAVEGASAGSTQADPKLADVEKGQVRFGPGSPAPGLGIKPLDVSGAGRRARR